MIIELELGAILAAQVATLALHLQAKAPVSLAAAAAPSDVPATTPQLSVEIVKRSGDGWVRVGDRHFAHGDVLEALAHPELAVRHADGRIQESA